MCASRARGGPRARPSHATTHPNNHQLHIVLNELRTDEHGKVIEPYYKSFAVRSEPFPYTSTVTAGFVSFSTQCLGEQKMCRGL